MKRTSMIASSAILLGSFFISGNVFAADQAQQTQTPIPAAAQTPVTADLTTPQQTTPKPPSDPDDPNKTENDPVNVTGESGNLGIAYYPKGFSFTGNLGPTKLTLNDSGSNTSSDNTTYNIGVKDNTRQLNSWTLTAQLQWSNSELPGSTITVTNPDNGKVKLNTNNGINPFKSTDLQQQSDVQGTNSDSVVISNSSTTIMTKGKATVGKGTYDYSLGSVGSLELMIPNATDLVAKSYNGNVNWNLQITPDTSSSSIN
ncbi:WxL domain-containing protein [Enterococcus casseliflavus]|uniref:WxL domain-containing protein n=1 Tax=Enterococcus casseliflavus TaxID=37734 RepID=UPI002DBD1B10|nr:WxL domain-containing protein [Enterococcus casseliflavus]MEB8416388.1 WxL domain-containing protein [Enterococcus casseliflavus]